MVELAHNRKFQMRRSLIVLFAAVLAVAPAQAATDEELKEVTATIINLNGLLCAKVVEIHGLELQGQFEVVCTEYRGGTGTVRYIMNAQEGTAFRAD